MRRGFAAASKKIAAISTISYIRAWVCLNPVSYTHLDVYKRQAYNRLVDAGFENSIVLIAYEMNDGIIVDGTLGKTFDMFLFEGCYNIEGYGDNATEGIQAWIDEHEGFADVYDLSLIHI